MNDTKDLSVVQLSMFPANNEIYLGNGDEVDDDFSLDGFQVVRGELVCDRQEPAITFNNNQIYVNSVCLKKLPNADYVQILIHKEKKLLAIRPCDEDARDAFKWKTVSSITGKQLPKHITARILVAMLFKQMGWDIQNRYRLIGKLREARGIRMFVFDLTSYKTFLKQKLGDTEIKRSPIAVLPYEWEGKFGMTVEEHDRSLAITTFKGFAIIDVKSDSVTALDVTE